MSHSVSERPQRFGGEWTGSKLKILQAYLETYTTLMKNQGFTLHYVDAFAGSGSVRVADDADGSDFLNGSVQIALDIDNRPFDHLLFVDIDARNVDSLQELIRNRNEQRRAEARRGNANDILPQFLNDMGRFDRAVVFLDPFGAQVDWRPTVQSIARSEKCDTWILFPSGYIRRFLIPRRGTVRSDADREELVRVFGDDPTAELQRPVSQPSFFDPPGEVETEAGTAAIVAAYQRRLGREFAEVAQVSRTLRNSNNAPIYEFIFAAANPRGAGKAVEIANHILTRL